jgi:hypothetical protein
MEGPLDPATLAMAAVEAALPYVTELGKAAAKSTAAAAGKSAWEWIKGKLTSAGGKEAVADLESAPGDADNRKAAEAALAKFLKSDPGALTELAQLLEKAGVMLTAQSANVGRDGNTANVDGDGNIVPQNSGSGSVSVNIGPARTGRSSKAG